MKVPLLPLYLVTSKTLDAKLESARTEGRTEARALAARQIEILLYNKTIKGIRPLPRRKNNTESEVT